MNDGALAASEELSDFADWAVGAPLRILLIVVGAVIIARVGGRALAASVQRTADASYQQRVRVAAAIAPAEGEEEEAAARHRQRGEAISSVLRSAVTVVVYLIALFLILGELGIDLAPLLAGAGVVGLAIGFGAQSLVKDFFSGLFILLEDQYAVGDIVDVGEATGVVENITLRLTRLRSVDGVVWHVPNGEIVRVGNMSQHWSRSLLDIEVAYDTDLRRAKELIADVARSYAEGDEDVLEEPEVWGVEALGASGILIRLVVKTRPSAQWRVSRELRERVKERFDAEGVEIPYPTQTLWMRTQGAERSEGTTDEGS